MGKKNKQTLKRKLVEILLSSSEDESENKKPKRNRIISDSESDDNNPPSPQTKQISPEFLAKIGYVAEKENLFSLNTDICKIWQVIVKKGLQEENRKKIIENSSKIQNLTTNAPILYIEIKASLTPNAVTRDEHLCQKQNQIGLAICGLSKILQERLDSQDTDTAENLSNCIRLLCDVHHLESKTRRAVILPGLNKNLKEALEKTDISKSLFGKNVSNLIKETRTIEKSTKELKSQPLNTWGPSSSKKQGGLSEPKTRPQQQTDKTKNYTANKRRQTQRQQLRSMTKPKQSRSHHHQRRQH